ncbi:MAG TPA: hypothetical protein P5186_27300 [Candidatus Paceibacterota bacterium]|nr:hypothetical protein [Candidatus Paceibacterota bacterium]
MLPKIPDAEPRNDPKGTIPPKTDKSNTRSKDDDQEEDARGQAPRCNQSIKQPFLFLMVMGRCLIATQGFSADDVEEPVILEQRIQVGWVAGFDEEQAKT